MSLSRRRIGDIAENIACQYLEWKGYTIVERNWQIQWGEIDIIATYEGQYTFIEVRYRRDESHGHPLDTFSRKKRHVLLRSIYRYIHMKKIDVNTIHIDFLGIMPRPEWGHRIWHMRDIPLCE